MRAWNPILTRELKERMRTLRAPVVLTIYLLVLGMVVFVTQRFIAEDTGFGPLGAAGLGRAVFHFLLFFTLMLICFLTPGFTAGSITSERERQTFPLLQVTMLRPSAIVLGKLASSMAFMFFLIVATLPLMSVSFVLGGVTPLEVLRGYGMVILTGSTIAMVGLGLSASLRKTVSATVLTYALVGLLAIGTVLGYGLIRLVAERSGRSGNGHVWTLVLNPFVGTASAIRGSGASGGPSTPFTSMFDFLAPRTFQGFAVTTEFGGVARAVPATGPVPAPDVVIGDGPAPFQVQPADAGLRRAPWRMPVWASTVGWYLALSVAGFLLAISGVRAPARGLRFGRRRAAPEP